MKTLKVLLFSFLMVFFSFLPYVKADIVHYSLQERIIESPFGMQIFTKEPTFQPFFRPYSPPYKILEPEKKTLIIFYLVLSCVSLILILLLYFYRKTSRYKKELEVSRKVLESLLEEKNSSLSFTLKRLKEEMDKLEAIFSNLDTGVALLDENGFILKANKAFQEIFERDPRFLLGKSLKAILEESADPVSRADLDKLGTSISQITLKLKTNYSYKVIFLKHIPLKELLNALVLVRDITTEKKWEAEVIRYTQFETLRIIASGLAHDLNNLLGAILNNTEILFRKADFPPYVHTKLQSIKNACLRAKSLTQELLIYGKSLILSPQIFSLPEFIREVTEFALAGSGIKVLYSFDPRIKYLECDKNLISIALHNMLINARQAMNDKGIIKITTELSKPYVEIAISDTGPGIPEKIKKNLFKPFVTTKPGGSGLGLFSAKRIVDAHGGKIEIESLPSQGTRVKIYLPYAEKDIIPAKAHEVPIPTFEGKKRLLLMDDEVEIRNSLKELLETFDFEVTTCENGEEALRLFEKEGPFDLVILDLTVPGALDGIQTFLELKKRDPDIKAILATGYAYKRETLDAKALGFKEVLIKPFSLESLLEVLKKITG